jgi:hypothetical protein
MIIFIAAAIMALILLTAAIANGRRWRLARVVRRHSEDRDMVSSAPRASPPEILTRASLIPLLQIEQRNARQFHRPPRLRRVTRADNVTGAPPLSIAYLRLFQNEPRTRTFIQGAWREFGYVHFLRSEAAVTPGEYRSAKRAGGVARLFITSIPEFVTRLTQPPSPPDRRRWRAFTDIAPRTIRVWDRYGSYPPNGYLCHGTIWKAAIDEILRRVDLVVLDLSGFMPKNIGIGYELQRVIDFFPIERIVFLADPSSSKRFLRDQIQAAWQKMAAMSPNAGTQPRTAYLTVTDHYRQIQRPPVQVPGPGPGQFVTQQQGPPDVRLLASRRQTRRLAAAVQERARHAPPPVRSMVRPPAAVWPAPAPVPAPRWEDDPHSASSALVAARRRVAKLIALAGAALFLASVTLLTSYVDNGTGPRSLFQATHGDPASPLYPRDFWAVADLLACVTISLLTARRWAMVCAAAAAFGLIGYTLYIPTLGLAPGFGPYGSSYWVSLAAAVVMALGAGVGATVTRSP